MTELFIETTAAAERIFGLPETINFINSVCENKTLLSSTYVWGEFRRTYLYDCIICHSVFTNSLEIGDNFATALKRLPRFTELRFKPRKLRRTFDVIARLHEQPFESLKQAVERLENDILYNLQTYFFEGIQSPLIDGANCQMTGFPQQISEPGEFGNLKFELVSKCTKKENPDCNIISFWQDHREDLAVVSNMVIHRNTSSTVATELAEFKSEAKVILENLENNTSEAFGKRCYAKIADLIICLECPTNVPIITSNKRHYRPLGETLGRPASIWFHP